MSTHLLLVQSQENPEPPPIAKFSGSGDGVATLKHYNLPTPLVSSGSGLLSVVDKPVLVIKPTMALSILDPTLKQAPTTLTVALTNGIAATEVRFFIDGTLVYRVDADSDGNLYPTSIPVPESVGAKGQHVLTAMQTGADSATGTFTIAQDPSPYPAILGPDAQAVDIPEATLPGGRRRWILQDLMPGGLGSYVLPLNPTSMTSPHYQRQISARHTTAVSGQYHLYEGSPMATEWSFEGYCPTQEMHDKLVAYSQLSRRFYIIDHRGRAWKVAIVGLDLRARLRQFNWAEQYTDWGHDYTVSAIIYEQDWVNPA